MVFTLGPPAVLTSMGIYLIYNARRHNCLSIVNGLCMQSLSGSSSTGTVTPAQMNSGVAIFSLSNPSKVIHRSDLPLFSFSKNNFSTIDETELINETSLAHSYLYDHFYAQSILLNGNECLLFYHCNDSVILSSPTVLEKICANLRTANDVDHTAEFEEL